MEKSPIYKTTVPSLPYPTAFSQKSRSSFSTTATAKMVSKILLSIGLVAAAANSILGHPMSFGDHDLRPQQHPILSVQTSSTGGDPGAPGGDGEKTADAFLQAFLRLPICHTNSAGPTVQRASTLLSLVLRLILVNPFFLPSFSCKEALLTRIDYYYYRH